VIRDRHSMRVAAEVAKRLFRSAKGAFGVDYPSGPEQQTKPSRERPGILKLRECSMKAQFALGMQLAQAVHKLAPEHFSQNCDGQEKTSLRHLPSRVVGSQSAGRNNTVNMRMMK
jgi:hypothetical protein